MLLFLTPGFARNEADSSCIPPLQMLADILSGWEGVPPLKIIALQYPEREGWYKWKGIDIYSAGGGNRKFPLNRIAWHRARQEIRRIHRESPVEIIHSFWFTEAALLAEQLKAELGCKHVCTLMGQDARASNRYLSRISTRPDRIIALSQFHADTWSVSTGTPVDQIIPWGLPKMEVWGSSEDFIDLLGVGSLIPLKRFEWFIDVFEQVKRSHSELKGKIIGDGPERKRLEEMIRSKGLSGSLELAGQMNRNQVLAEMGRSRVLLHPSSYESFGMVILEALWEKVHVVATPVGIAPEIPTVSLAENVDEMTRKVIEAFENPEPPDFSAVASYSLANVAEAYRILYSEITASR